jgi:hypothetical protein
MVHRAASRDAHVMHVFAEVGSRRRSPALLFRPDNFAKVVKAGAR